MCRASPSPAEPRGAPPARVQEEIQGCAAPGEDPLASHRRLPRRPLPPSATSTPPTGPPTSAPWPDPSAAVPLPPPSTLPGQPLVGPPVPEPGLIPWCLVLILFAR